MTYFVLLAVRGDRVLSEMAVIYENKLAVVLWDLAKTLVGFYYLYSHNPDQSAADPYLPHERWPQSG